MFESAKNGAMKIIPTKLTQNAQMKLVGDLVTQNDHGRALARGENALWCDDARVRADGAFLQGIVNKRVDKREYVKSYYNLNHCL